MVHCTCLDPDIIWYPVVLYKAPDKVEVCITSSWICNLDLFETAFKKMVEEYALLFICHRVPKSLITIAQVS